MADEFADAVKGLEKFLEEKQNVVTKERELVEKLDAVLQQMGYRITPAGTNQTGAPRRRGRPAKNPQALMIAGPSVRRRGRPPGSKNKSTGTKRRRGRPPRAK